MGRVVDDFVDCMDISVGGADMVSWLSDMSSSVVVVLATDNDWFNCVLLSVLVLGGVGILVVLSWSVVSAGWLSVRVLSNINNWGVVWVVWVVRIASWVGVNGLVVVVDSFLVDWKHLVGSVFLKVVRDGFVWHSDIPFGSMVFVSVAWVVLVVLESDSGVLLTVMVGSVVNSVLSLVIDELVLHRVVLSLSTLDMGGDLVNAGLLDRSVV